MALFLDSASVAEAQRAAELGFVVGITTNPKIMAREDRPALQGIPELCDVLCGPGLIPAHRFYY